MSHSVENSSPAATHKTAASTAEQGTLQPTVETSFARDVLAGLARRQKSIPSTWLYDHRGSELFEQITHLPEYYPTRNEMQILDRCAAEIAEAAGPGAVMLELGSGSSRKTPILLGALQAPAAYLPIDISAQFLAESAASLRLRFPSLPIMPVVADFTQLHELPELAGIGSGGRRVVFFPGSTIGNFTPDDAVVLLDRIGRVAGAGALLVIGTDTTHDPAVLIPAYDDAAGVTAAFDKNLLERINRELGGTFDLSAFEHEARFDPLQYRVEMHLVSARAQQVEVLGRRFDFAAGESIHTENSYKHSLIRFRALAAHAGWAARQLWMDDQSRFAVHLLARGHGPRA